MYSWCLFLPIFVETPSGICRQKLSSHWIQLKKIPGYSFSRLYWVSFHDVFNHICVYIQAVWPSLDVFFHAKSWILVTIHSFIALVGPLPRRGLTRPSSWKLSFYTKISDGFTAWGTRNFYFRNAFWINAQQRRMGSITIESVELSQNHRGMKYETRYTNNSSFQQFLLFPKYP